VHGQTSRSTITHCTECGDRLLDERIELGYDYCTKPDCQARRHRGLTVTTIGLNKSADVLVVADRDEIARRGEAGEFTRKDTGLGVGYRDTGRQAAPRRDPAQSHRPSAAPRRRFTEQQEQVVRLYHEMGLTPTRIVEKARTDNPKLGITPALVAEILAMPPGGRRRR